jgi:hypothetical protein
MKKIREEIIEYWHDEESGRVIVKAQDKFLVRTDENGKEQWKTHDKTIPLI